MNLFTDLYELTMAQAYWQAGATADARFSMFARRLPSDRGYMVFAGLEDMLDALDNLRFSADDINYLRSLAQFDAEFLDYLRGLRFTGSARAMPEATPFFADEPVLEVRAPVIEAQIVETLLLNQFNLQTMLAGKAARVVTAADGRAAVDFAARRAQGLDAAVKFARSAYIVGFAGTSNVQAGKRHDIPLFGTMAHSFITAFESELDAFNAYAAAFPNSSTFLVDTYDTIAGVQNAIRAAKRMRESGCELRAVRLDSGDLLDLSRKARAMLDAAGLPNVQVFVSGGLDEYEIERLAASGAAIDGFGVGTMVGVSADYPWLDCVYKMTEYDGRPVLKLSEGKQTLPGGKQVFRIIDDDGMYAGDVIACDNEPAPPGATPLLREVMRDGVRMTDAPTLTELRSRFAREFDRLPSAHKRLRSPSAYSVSVSDRLSALQRQATRAALRHMPRSQ